MNWENVLSWLTILLLKMCSKEWSFVVEKVYEAEDISKLIENNFNNTTQTLEECYAQILAAKGINLTLEQIKGFILNKSNAKIEYVINAVKVQLGDSRIWRTFIEIVVYTTFNKNRGV